MQEELNAPPVEEDEVEVEEVCDCCGELVEACDCDDFTTSHIRERKKLKVKVGPTFAP